MAGVHEFGVASLAVEFVDEEVQGLAFAGELVLFVYDVMDGEWGGSSTDCTNWHEEGEREQGLTDD